MPHFFPLETERPRIIVFAQRREETRGCHWREDFPAARDEWLGHLLAGIGPDNNLSEVWEPI